MFFVFAVVILLIGLGLLVAREAQGGRTYTNRSVGLVVVVIAIICMAFSFIVTIPAGNVGVKVLFGQVQGVESGDFLPEGLNLVNPLIRVHEISIRTETYTMSSIANEGQKTGNDAIMVLSSDNLLMPIDLSVLYRVVSTDAPWLYRNLGTTYEENIIRPAIATGVTEAFSQYSFQEASSTRRDEIPNTIKERIQIHIDSLLKQYPNVKGKGFEIVDIQVRKIEPPEKVKASIEDKIQAEQRALAMKYVLQKESQEAERKRIEAKGIADFQNIVTQGISDKLLEWKGIEATLKLAESNNAKIVVVGGGKNGLPLIFNLEKEGSQP